MVRLTNQLHDLYPSGVQLRSLQRRVKAWRAQWAHQLIFAASRDTRRFEPIPLNHTGSAD
jgi:hypothetical protein